MTRLGLGLGISKLQRITTAIVSLFVWGTATSKNWGESTTETWG
jgi:hypothetical protein